MVEVPASEAPKKRGRPPKKTKPEAPAVPAVEEVTALVAGIFHVLAVPLGEHWRVTEAEARSIGDPLSRIMARYMTPETVSKYSDGMALAFAVTGVVLPRIVKTRQKKEEKRRVSTGESPGNDNAGGTAQTSNGKTDGRIAGDQNAPAGVANLVPPIIP